MTYHSLQPGSLAGKPLSDREQQVAVLLDQGKKPKQIADVLGISVKTAMTYRSRILEKRKVTA